MRGAAAWVEWVWEGVMERIEVRAEECKQRDYNVFVKLSWEGSGGKVIGVRCVERRPGGAGLGRRAVH